MRDLLRWARKIQAYRSSRAPREARGLEEGPIPFSPKAGCHLSLEKMWCVLQRHSSPSCTSGTHGSLPSAVPHHTAAQEPASGRVPLSASLGSAERLPQGWYHVPVGRRKDLRTRALFLQCPSNTL